jgi:sarcosine oxidase subunit gamma
MSEAPARRTALAGRFGPSPADKSCRLAEAPPATRFSLRGRPGIAKAAAPALGFALPPVGRSATSGDVTALALSPDEWLLIAPDGYAVPVADGYAIPVADGHAASLADALPSALANVPHALVDVSHRNTAITVSGPAAARILNHGCPLDLGLAAFPVGFATRTLLAKAEIVLWRTSEDQFRVEVWRSFSHYAANFLAEARLEYEVT